MSPRTVSATLLILATTVLAGCGDGDEEAAKNACKPAPAALGKQPRLPAGFPEPADVAYTGVELKGPTTIVSAYLPGDVDHAYTTYRSAFHQPFAVTKAEHEEVDAEVNFASSKNTGQVKLLQSCRDRTTVTLTIRPA
jgi:hypothetical protein